MAIVYCTTNLINGKKYIGSHKDNNPKYLGSGTLLMQAIAKYGRNNFHREIIWEGSEIDRYKIEEDFILKFNAVNDKNYYNVSHKGNGLPKGFKFSEESKNKYKLERQERLNKYRESKIVNFIKSEAGIKHIKKLNAKINSDKDIINKRNESLKRRYAYDNHHMLGVSKSENWKEKRKKQCIHCGIICDISNHTKWHGDKCKNINT